MQCCPMLRAELAQSRECHLPSARIATSGTFTRGFAYVPPMLPILDTVNVPPAQPSELSELGSFSTRCQLPCIHLAWVFHEDKHALSAQKSPDLEFIHYNVVKVMPSRSSWWRCPSSAISCSSCKRRAMSMTLSSPAPWMTGTCM